MTKLGCACLIAAAACGQFEDKRIGTIDLFGYGKRDPDALRASLPLRVGDRYTPDSQRAVEKAAGRGATAAFVCCTDSGELRVYVGVPGKTARAVRYNAAPKGDARLPEAGVALYQKAMDLLFEAAEKHAPDDNSQGYALSGYPPLREAQLAMREYAVQHPAELRRVLASAREDDQRIAAAHLLGYAEQSDEQIAALVAASRDANEHVRNNAVRALGVLAENPAVARRIPAAPFIDMLHSLTWSDRNKALWLLSSLTASRDPALLARLRREALEPLKEMARWPKGHSDFARLILERIAH